MVKTWILVYREEKVTYLFVFLPFFERSSGFFLIFLRVFHVRFLVFFMSISWFLSFCGYFLSVSGFESSRLNDCFLTVTGCFGLHSECFLVYSSGIFLLTSWLFPGFLGTSVFFSRKFPGCLIYFLLTVTRVFLVNHVCCSDSYESCFTYLNSLLFH